MLTKLFYALCLLNGSMNFNQTCTGLSFGGVKKTYESLVTLTLIFKVTGSRRMLKNALSALYLLYGWIKPHLKR